MITTDKVVKCWLAASLCVACMVLPASGATPEMMAVLQGNELLVASNDGEGHELCYCFKPCMQNKLMTFSHVGVRTVSSTTSSSSINLNDSKITWLNVATSDNIGPVGVKGYNDFVGGNHRWRRASSSGQKGAGPVTDVLTARCDSCALLANGTLLLQNTPTACRQVTVEVWNTIFDPLVEPAEGDTMLSSPLIAEHVLYTLQDNSIAVTVEHHYLKSFTVKRYYGMQSMFGGEVLIMTPDGAWPTWTAQDKVNSFNKHAYPSFQRFIEKNAEGWLQSSWLLPKEMGNHAYIDSNMAIFTRNTSKSYHVLMNHQPVTRGNTKRWSGIYTWALPVADNDTLLAYPGIVNGQQVLYVDVKSDCEAALVPCRHGWSNATVIRLRGDITFTPAASGLAVTAEAGASAIIVTKPRSDVSDDGRVDIDDINAVVNVMLGQASPHSDRADINCDGTVGVDDLNAIINAMLEQRKKPV
ncbi:MAG: hypothetical protein IJT30_10265 [Muribaculaceae bacterium]|nr:hypothetical protein [Muribaculaceae bacterium]